MSLGRKAPIAAGTLDSAPMLAHYAQVCDTKASGTDGGASSAGAQTRVLNTLNPNNIGASLASNQVTLLAGTYWVEGYAPSFNAGRSKLYLYNVTDSVAAVAGQMDYTTGSSAGMVSSFRGYVTITISKVFEVRQYIQTAQATNGLGVSTVSAGLPELYAQLHIWKVG